jgi:hypothetical protein
MSTTRLTPDEVVTLARIARGAVYLNRDGNAAVVGGAAIDSGTMNTLVDAGLIDIGDAVPTLTGAGRSALAGQAGLRTASPAGASLRS